MHLQTVRWYIQYRAKILSSKGPKFPEKYLNRNFLVNMHMYTLCPKYLQSFIKFCAAVLLKIDVNKKLKYLWHSIIYKSFLSLWSWGQLRHATEFSLSFMSVNFTAKKVTPSYSILWNNNILRNSYHFIESNSIPS